ncbi:hypothetical protein TcYC6_0021300 [Trypanosoma cruzi]|nr:hypothetical protein TcYC6_0022270 [Trypanosoma cruzi]KAF8282635.1 hypothetical protein TcYC6_0022290 [Trypanosoma cruzi]KAF8282668.1 hypothetical protein TcYC6_0021330 [Trypanosoma cruzi]KAF8282781.1 hypothetical protein TcYC6_0021300 [Trypanosoma cruzi]
MRSLLWPHCVDPAPALATLIGVPFRQGIAAASDSTPGSTVLSVRASWCFPSGYGEGFLRRKRRAIQRLQVWCRDFVGVIRSGTIARGGRRTMGALDRKALPRVSQRSAHRKRRLSTTSGRGRSFALNTASSILLPFGIPAIILLFWYCAQFGVERDAGEAPQCHTAMPYIALARTSARRNVLRVSLLVLHATDKISFRWSRRWSGSSWSLAARAHSTSVLELDAQKGRHAPHGGQRALASRVWWGRVAVEKGRCASYCWRFFPWGFLWSAPLRRLGLLVATRLPHPRRRAA